MKKQTWSVVSLSGAALVAVMGFAGTEPETKPGGPPPLRVDRSAPLRLAQPGKAEPKLAGASPAAPVADNTACYCCHVNYKEESLVQVHAAANVGCVSCHGPSQAHRNDEDNTTPPEVMFPTERIDAACHACHETHDAPATKVIEQWRAFRPEKTDPAKIVCTDCHGQHRLARRVVRWDKATGKLLLEPEAVKKP